MFDRTLVIDRCTIQLITGGTISWTSRVPKDQNDLKLPSGKQTYWKWPWKKWICPIKNGDFPWLCKRLPEGTVHHEKPGLGGITMYYPSETRPVKCSHGPRLCHGRRKSSALVEIIWGVSGMVIKSLGRDSDIIFWAVTWEILGHF